MRRPRALRGKENGARGSSPHELAQLHLGLRACPGVVGSSPWHTPASPETSAETPSVVEVLVQCGKLCHDSVCSCASVRSPPLPSLCTDSAGCKGAENKAPREVSPFCCPSSNSDAQQTFCRKAFFTKAQQETLAFKRCHLCPLSWELEPHFEVNPEPQGKGV